MHSLFRSARPLSRPSPFASVLARTSQGAVRSYAHQSYGGEEMTGHPKSDAPNPKTHLEHPGPESPMAEKGNPSSSSSNKSEGSAKSQGETSSGGRPAISDPGPAPEQANEEVKKHNEEVAKSHDRPANQIDEEGKVEKGFWTDKTGN